MGVFGKIRNACAGLAMGIQMGLGWGGAFAETVQHSPDRSQVMYWTPADSRQHLPSWTRRQINAKVQWLFENFGVVKEGVRGITRHTVGKGRFLQLNSDDPEWNEAAELDWERYALSKDRCDQAGRRNFYDFQNLACEQRLKVGEFLAAFCQNPRWGATYADGSPMEDDAGDQIGDPCVQAFHPDEVQNPANKGPADRVFDGVELDADQATAFYHVLNSTGITQAVPVSEMIHWYKPDGINQVRGISEFAQSVNPLIDIHDLIKVTTKSGKLHGAMALMIKRSAKLNGQGAVGGIKRGFGPQGAPGGEGNNSEVSQVGGPPLEKVFSGGAIMYVGEEGDIKTVSSTQPSPLVEPFVTDVLMNDACNGWGVPREFFWAMAKLNGTNIRAVLIKADLLFSVLGDGVDTEMGTPWATRYLLHRIATGKLRACKDPNWLDKIAWQGPPRLTVDEGRTGTLEIAQLANGVETMQSIDDKRGRNWRTKTRQWFREWGFAYRCAVEEKVPWALKLYRASQPGAAGAVADEPAADDPEPGPDDPQPGDDKPGKEDDK